MVQIELTVLQGQCLDRRSPYRDTMHSEIVVWERDRNHLPSTTDWQLTTLGARIEFKGWAPAWPISLRIP